MVSRQVTDARLQHPDFANLFLNSGHGTLGWTMACGSGRVLSDLISGTKPEIETADLAISRYH